jgi:hypothetical protein
LITALVTLAAGYLAIAALLFFAQRSLLYQPPARAELPSPDQGALLRIPGPPEAPEVVATWLAPSTPTAFTVVAFHGNAEQLADGLGLARTLHSLGLGVLSVEYPGYGLSPGAPSRTSLVAAAQTALTHLHGPLGVPVSRTAIFGHSLGSAVAAELAAAGQGARLVLVSPMTSIREMAGLVAPFLPVSLLVRDRFDTLALAPRLPERTLILHGTNDEVIPFRMGQTLSRALPRARFVPIAGGQHNDLFAAYGREVWPQLATFLRTDE